MAGETSGRPDKSTAVRNRLISDGCHLRKFYSNFPLNSLGLRRARINPFAHYPPQIPYRGGLVRSTQGVEPSIGDHDVTS